MSGINDRINKLSYSQHRVKIYGPKTKDLSNTSVKVGKYSNMPASNSEPKKLNLGAGWRRKNMVTLPKVKFMEDEE